jgi:hypothetical protein
VLVTQLLADSRVGLPPACVVDVGRIAGRGWAVIEANSVWGAGIYGCDPVAVLEALSLAVMPRAELTPEDAAWARPVAEVELDAPPQKPMPDEWGLITLYRPVGERELALIAASGYRAVPSRLPEQPIFYPVLNERYATEIARGWNTRDAASGDVGHVMRFQVRASFLARYSVQVAGASHHQEYWVPAEELDAFNDAIVGTIEIVATYRGEQGT